MLILGLNAFHGDAAAALLRDGAFAAGIEEERLNRVKHWAGFPAGAIAAVLAHERAALGDVDHVAVSRDPRAHLLEKALFAFRRRPSLAAVRSRLANARQVRDVGALLRALPGGDAFRGRVHAVEHHRAHLASAFLCSPFPEAACLTVDGFGDFLSSMAAVGRGGALEVLDEVPFPHSLGILYTAVTQFLGFPRYGDEYKVMGLAAFGRPRFAAALAPVLRLTPEGGFALDVDWFRHASEGVTMSWDEGEPVLGPLWSERFAQALGPASEPGATPGEREADIAASLQQVYEEALVHRLRWLRTRTGLDRLCLAGGCAQNSVANGRIADRTGFTEVFVQPAAGDAGTSLGAALWVEHVVLGRPRRFVLDHAAWGPALPDEDVVDAARAVGPGFDVRHHEDEAALVAETAEALAAGEVVGWYQGRTEWGPRALGNRSILADPRRADMRDVLNARIKRREAFRPFAPAVLEERARDYFETSRPDPFMVRVVPVRGEKRGEIPAVTHVDGTARLQTVSRAQNPRFHALISAFAARTGVPVLLNTSFNESEPIVHAPAEAMACFLRTRMDRLVLGDWSVTRGRQECAGLG